MTTQTVSDFFGKDDLLIRSIDSLLDMNAKGLLVPHGIGGHAVTLLKAAKASIQAAHAVALPPGFVAVPVEPTHEMLETMREKHWEIRGCQLCAHDYRDIHTAMLAARPEVK